MGYWARFALTIGAAIALLVGCGGPQMPTAPSATTGMRAPLRNHQTFRYTGAEQTFTVPAGVTSIGVDARGAAGGGPSHYYHFARGGRGGRVTAMISVQPDETLYVFVGGKTHNYNGGYNGGGEGATGGDHCDWGYGGGGASDLRETGDTLPDRILVAGGGGGGGGFFGNKGGLGGGKKGDAGRGGASGGGSGGGGGTQHNGGTRGYGGGGKGYRFHGHRGTRGQLGVGGNGGLCGYTHYVGGSGGGGGGGYFGGGGAGGGAPLSPGGGGGGGSGYVEPSATNSRMWRGWQTAQGNGLVIIRWR